MHAKYKCSTRNTIIHKILLRLDWLNLTLNKVNSESQGCSIINISNKMVKVKVVQIWHWAKLNEISKSQHSTIGLVGWLYWRFRSLQRYFSHIVTWKQEINHLWKFKWQGRESNSDPLAPQAKSLTTRPPLLPVPLEMSKEHACQIGILK